MRMFHQAGNPGDFSNSGFNAPDFSKSDTTIFQGTIAYEFNDSLSIKSITSYSKTDSEINVDFDATPQPLLAVVSEDENKAFTQELQLDRQNGRWSAEIHARRILFQQ